MGLTIHYGLKARTQSANKALAMVKALHQKCLDLPFKEVGDVFDLSGKQCIFDREDRDNPNGWLLCQAAIYVDYTWKRKLDTKTGFHTMRAVKPAPDSRSHYGMGVNPLRIIGFTAWPGEGCEQSNIGLCLFPSTIEVEQYGYKDTVRTGQKGWTWNSFCKTQYANDPAAGGLANFLRCHLTVCAMLDAAKDLGLDVDVYDEGGYWKKRDVKALSQEVGDWDKMIAGFAGIFKDTFGPAMATAMDGRTDAESLEAHAPVTTAEHAKKLAEVLKTLVPVGDPT